MNKKLIINSCDDCVYFDNHYRDYNETCVILKRKMSIEQEEHYEIPIDCPLETTNELRTNL